MAKTTTTTAVETKATAEVINLNALNVQGIKDAVKARALKKADALAELNRRIAKREAAGKYPMPFVIEYRDQLAA
jgi:hypothetical protein